MTTGTWTVGYVTPIVLDYGPTSLRNVSTKTWNGADDPVRTAQALNWKRLRDERIAAIRAAYESKNRPLLAVLLADHRYWRSLPRARSTRRQTPHGYVASGSTTVDDAVLDILTSSGVRTATFQSSMGGLAEVKPPINASQQTALLGRLQNKVFGSTFDPWVALAEGKESLQMIFRSASILRRAMKAFKRGDVRQAYDIFTTEGLKPPHVSANWALRPAQDAASAWLQLNWGWAPLVNDIIGGAEMLAHFTECPVQLHYKASLSLPYDVKETSPAYVYGWERKRLKRVTRLTALLSEAAVPSLAQPNGWDLAGALYEATPFSWCLDYVVSVGNYLSNRALAQRLQGVFVQTEFVSADIVVSSFSPSSGAATPRCDSCRYVHRRWSVNRVVTSSLPIPTIEVTPLGNVSSWRRAANEVSVLLQMGRSRSFI